MPSTPVEALRKILEGREILNIDSSSNLNHHSVVGKSHHFVADKSSPQAIGRSRSDLLDHTEKRHFSFRSTGVVPT